MKFFSRQIVVQAFRLPHWGQQAEETPPKWLVDRLQTGELEMNTLGGLVTRSDWGVMSCAAGDIVVLFQDLSVGFEKPETFERDYKAIIGEELIAA